MGSRRQKPLRQRSVRRDTASVATPVVRPRRRNWWPIAATVAVFAVVGVVVVEHFNAPPDAPVISPNAPAPPWQQVQWAPPVALPEPLRQAPTPKYDDLFFDIMMAHERHTEMAELNGWLTRGDATFLVEDDQSHVVPGSGGRTIAQIKFENLGNGQYRPAFTVSPAIFGGSISKALVRRSILHEYNHLRQQLNGEFPVSVWLTPSSGEFTKEGIRRLYEGEMASFVVECKYTVEFNYFTGERDPCLVYANQGEKALRRFIAEMYGSSIKAYKPHREFLLRVADNPTTQ